METSKGTLFVSFVYPSMAGTGAQIRAASLVRMLAARGTVHVVVVGLVNMPGPCDSCVTLGATAITYVRIALKSLPAHHGPAKGNFPTPELPKVTCEAGALAAWLTEYALEHSLERLFVFRMETLTYVQGCLDSFRVRLLDLDELPSRHHRVIAALCDEAAAAVEKRAQLAATILEKRLVPRFHRVFASSSVEAEQVGRQVGCRTDVLPNVRPLLARPVTESARGSAPDEFLFVGSLEYLPNTDAVTWFSQEVWPFLREKLDHSARFRVVGFGNTEKLNFLGDIPGVCLEGYQADLGPFYARAATAIVPLRAGTGTRLKILEAFAYGCPVVSTNIGAEGLEVVDGEHLLLADSVTDFAHACLAIVQQPQLCVRLTENASRLCSERYSEEALGRSYDAAMAQDGGLPMDDSS